MGATGLYHELPGTLSEQEVVDFYEKTLVPNAEEDSGGDPYSGDWNTLPLLLVLSGVAETTEEAYKRCLGESEKWKQSLAIRAKKDEEEVWVIAGWGAE
jgi:hypothetical protein